MNQDEKLTKLEEYRAQALEQLTGMSDYLISRDDIDVDTIITLARSTGDITLLGRALEKVKTMEDQQAKSEALLALLDEIEYETADSVGVPEQADPADHAGESG
ncbi:MAG: hypothetical protein ABI397_00020 [Candidatus Saccharimonas sp.]